MRRVQRSWFLGRCPWNTAGSRAGEGDMAFLTAALVAASLGIPTEGVPLPPARPEMTHKEPEKAPATPAVAVETEHGPPTDCDKRLAAMAVFTPKPTLAGPGACGGADLIELDAVMLSDG